MDVTEQSVAFLNLTETELKQMHRRLGHLSVARFTEVSRKACHDVVHKMVERLTYYYQKCQIYGMSPGRLSSNCQRKLILITLLLLIFLYWEATVCYILQTSQKIIRQQDS